MGEHVRGGGIGSLCGGGEGMGGQRTHSYEWAGGSGCIEYIA